VVWHRLSRRQGSTLDDAGSDPRPTAEAMIRELRLDRSNGLDSARTLTACFCPFSMSGGIA
jgi:hypothetical protein